MKLANLLLEEVALCCDLRVKIEKKKPAKFCVTDSLISSLTHSL